MIFKVLLVRQQHQTVRWMPANKELSSTDAHWLNISLVRSVPQGSKAGWVGMGRKTTATREWLSVEVHSGNVSKKPTKVPIRDSQYWANTMKTSCFPPNLLSLCTYLPQVGEKWSKERKWTEHRPHVLFSLCWLGKPQRRACIKDRRETFDYFRWSSAAHFTWDNSEVTETP